MDDDQLVHRLDLVGCSLPRRDGDGVASLRSLDRVATLRDSLVLVDPDAPNRRVTGAPPAFNREQVARLRELLADAEARLQFGGAA